MFARDHVLNHVDEPASEGSKGSVPRQFCEQWRGTSGDRPRVDRKGKDGRLGFSSECDFVLLRLFVALLLQSFAKCPCNVVEPVDPTFCLEGGRRRGVEVIGRWLILVALCRTGWSRRRRFCRSVLFREALDSYEFSTAQEWRIATRSVELTSESRQSPRGRNIVAR